MHFFGEETFRKKRKHKPPDGTKCGVFEMQQEDQWSWNKVMKGKNIRK
jgi:hypothetical protein